MSTRVVHKSHRERMRERFRKNGLPAFKEHEILEMLLFTVLPRVNTNEVAHRLLSRFGSIAGVLSASDESLQEIRGVGEKTACHLRFISEVYSGIIVENFRCTPLVNCDSIGLYSIIRMRMCNLESICIAFTDKDGMIIEESLFSNGKDNGEDKIDSRFAGAPDGACGVICIHSHPGESAEPSPDDFVLAEKLKSEAATHGIRDVWHVIVADGEYCFV